MKYFATFRFDESDRKLWSGPHLVPLTRKAADLLACLVSDAGATVSHQKLMQSVWPDTHVQQDNIKVLVHELRHALGDTPATPRFVESDAGRGYAFVAALAEAPCPLLEGTGLDRAPLLPRDTMLAVIDDAIERAMDRREPQCVLLEGRAGSGKTTACREVSRRAGRWPSLRMAYGRADSTSVGPFAPVVTMLERLVQRYPALVGPAIDRHAPAWASLLRDRNGTGRRRANPPPPVESLAFEFVNLFGEIGQDAAFLLVLEDLHWSGRPVLELLRHVGAQALPSRVVVIGTYAPFGSTAPWRAGEPAEHTVLWQGHQTPLQVLPLSRVEVRQFLEKRFGRPCAEALVDPVFRTTVGHPASIAHLADDLAASSVLQYGLTGWSLRAPLKQLPPLIADALAASICLQIDGLAADERQLLDAAAASGWRFTDEAVSGRLGAASVETVRDALDRLAAHVPVYERVSVARASDAPAAATYRFRYKPWFELLRSHSTVASV